MNAQLAPSPHDRRYIGGGNIAGILGVSPYKTPLQEYLTIVGEAEPPDADRLRFYARRKALEPFAVELFLAEVKGREVGRVNHRYVDPEYAFIKAEIDAETDSEENIEIKSVHPLAAKDWGPAGGDEIPVYVTAQAMHGLMVTGRRVCYPVAMIGFDDFRMYRVERDDETIAAMREREVAFWREHVECLQPPEPTTSEDVQRLFDHDNGEPIEATPEILDLLDEYRQAKAAAKHADALAERIKVFMGPATTLTADGAPLMTWKTQTAHRFDQKAFAAAEPALFEQFKHASTSRVLRLK
ncbi:MAG TPA: YqaJ viral recombinase family protein [Rhodanobacteraceae bacterium]|nr:YqaJ viral recombinase family protein [Rhodanobacteraceae bacterium]